MREERAGLAARAGGMLLRPLRTWEAVDAEPAETAALLSRYVAPLAAIPAVCGAVGVMVFGFDIADVGVRPGLLSTLLESAAGFVLTLVSVYVLGLAISAIAPVFGGLRDFEQALKLASYSGTAVWVAGLFYLYPGLQLPVLMLGALWSLYALFVGLPMLMRIPFERHLTAFAAVLGVVLTLALVRTFLAAKAAELGGPLALG